MYSIGNQGKIMRKLLGKPTPDSAHDTAAAAAAAVTSSPTAPPPYRPTSSQDVVYNAGAPIVSLDRSPDGRSAVLAGRHVLKTVTFDGLAVKEGIDLRALIAAQPSQRNNMSTSVSDQLSIKAVKWGQPQGGNPVIFTAGTSGKIFQYDLVRAGTTTPGSLVDCIQIREDSRQINSLDINPHRSTWLLSGSQDGIVRCFDIREPTQTMTGLTFRSFRAFKCNADGVHHVQWSPKDGFIFACATEQGSLLKWDIRKHTAPILRIKVHEKTCTSMAWHPDGIHIATGGVDSKCHIWDMSKQDKRQKPKWTIPTPAPPEALAWRPGQWSATAQGKRASQLAIAYDEAGSRRYGTSAVHLWDLARPTMPYKEIQRFDMSPSAILWHDQYLLWTAGQDGIFSQCDISFAPKVIDRQAVSTMAFSPRGDVLMLLDERPPPQRPPRPHVLHHEAIAVSSYSSSPATPKLGVSRSDSEDDAIGSFIGPKRRSSRRRRPSTRSTATPGTTPPAASGMEEVMSLEQTIKATGPYRPQQSMAVGHVPAATNVDVYRYLTVNYLEALCRDLPYSPGSGLLPDRIAIILEHYAKAATNVRKFRLAQTWRILAYAVEMLLDKRAQYHFDRRMDRLHYSERRKSEAKAKAKAMEMEEVFTAPTPTIVDGEETPRKVFSLASLGKTFHPKSLLSEELVGSTSNVPTPVARPVMDDSPETPHEGELQKGRELMPVVEPESFVLPPPATHSASLLSRKRLDSVPLSIASHDSVATHASTEGYDFYDTEAIMNKAVDIPTSEPKPTQTTEYQEGSSPSTARKPRQRQDSEDSYVHLFSISAESKRTKNPPRGSIEGSSNTGQATRAAILAELRKGAQEGSEPRARGSDLHKSPERNPLPPPFRTMLPRTETDMTAFTDEHHAITQTTTDSFESRFPSQMDADFVIPSPLIEAPASDDFPTAPEDDPSPFIVETDYLYWPDDHPYPFPANPSSESPAVSCHNPLQPYSLISRALAFEAKSSALNASAIVLLLKPLLPDGVLDDFQTAAILRQHHARLMSMELFTEAALLRKLCIKGWPGGALQCWGDNYPAIFTPAQQGVQASFVCSACHKPRDVDRTAGSVDSVWRCDRCRAIMAGCAVCGGRDSAVPPRALPLPSSTDPATWSGSTLSAEEVDGAENSEQGEKNDEDDSDDPALLATWWYCPGCGHGGHSSCLESWHAALEPGGDPALEDAPHMAEPSEGCCPLDGCGHRCLPARRGLDNVVVRPEDVSRAVREATRAMAKANAAAAAEAASRRGVGAAAEASQVAAQFADEQLQLQNQQQQQYQHQHSELGSGALGGGSGGGGGGGGHGTKPTPPVRSDGNDIPQSRAVEMVRESLGGAAGLGSGIRVGTGILSSSPGRSGIGAERERRKSVKFVSTDERR